MARINVSNMICFYYSIIYCLLIILFSFLNLIDKKNFNDTCINLYIEKAIEYVFDLFVDTIEDRIDNANSPVNVVVRKPSRVAMDDDDEMMELYKGVRTQVTSQNVVAMDRQQNVERARNDLRSRITASMDAYKRLCMEMNMIEYLDLNGNDLYKTMKAKNSLDAFKMDWDDALYYSKFFDATKWWMKHEQQFPELAMGATLILGKPTHNAFQERVFSRGTHTDNRLKKNLTEEAFEMSVMNAINGTQIDDIYHIMQPRIMSKEKDRQKELKIFIENRSKELDLSTEEACRDLDAEDDRVHVVPEYESVYVEESDDDDFSFDDDDYDSIVEEMDAKPAAKPKEKPEAKPDDSSKLVTKKVV